MTRTRKPPPSPHKMTSMPVPRDTSWSDMLNGVDGPARVIAGDNADRIATHDGLHVIGRWKVIGGRAEPVLVSVFTDGETPITADGIRALPLGTILAGMRTDYAWEANHPGIDGDPRQAVRVAAVKGPRSGQTLDDDVVAEVSEVYRRAWLIGRPVTEAVAEHFSISRSAAAKRIMRARATGLLDGVGPKQ